MASLAPRSFPRRSPYHIAIYWVYWDLLGKYPVMEAPRNVIIRPVVTQVATIPCTTAGLGNQSVTVQVLSKATATSTITRAPTLTQVQVSLCGW